MANLLLTTRCNRACKFCFASEEVALASARDGRPREEWSMSSDMIEDMIAFHKRSRLPHVSLLGGEPTLHKEFPAIVQRILDAGMRVRVFTGGLMPRAVRDYLASCDKKDLDVIVNLSAPHECRKGEFDKIVETIEGLTSLCSLSFTICQPDFSYDFLVDVIERTNCRRSVRISMALPMLTDQQPSLDPSQYRLTAKQIMKFASSANEHDIGIGFDCGFVMCMFTAEELGLLHLWNADTTFRCSPIIDINPEGEVFSCFATTGLHRSKIDEFPTRMEFEKYFFDSQRPYRSFGVFDECATCLYKMRGQCGGGCLSFVVRQFEGSGFEVPTASRSTCSLKAPFEVPSVVNRKTCRELRNL
jgi:radical SAM protein with 4Fe4S-binding SPASM domain